MIEIKKFAANESGLIKEGIIDIHLNGKNITYNEVLALINIKYPSLFLGKSKIDYNHIFDCENIIGIIPKNCEIQEKLELLNLKIYKCMEFKTGRGYIHFDTVEIYTCSFNIEDLTKLINLKYPDYLIKFEKKYGLEMNDKCIYDNSLICVLK